jgi:uncharacterized repeat protein (TIGR03943 family)
MFGKLSPRNIALTFIMCYLFLYIFRLYISGNMGLYIHPRYNGFVVIMSFFAATLLLAGLVTGYRQKAAAHTESRPIRLIDAIVVIFLVAGFVLPAKPLSERTVGERGILTPTVRYSHRPDRCPTVTPTAIRGWVMQLSEFHPDCSDNKPIELIARVLPSDSVPLPDGMVYFGRVVISCCVIDARPYALPLINNTGKSHASDTWLHVFGRIRIKTLNQQPQFVIEPTNIKEIADPSKPYEYINDRSYITQPEIGQ